VRITTKGRYALRAVVNIAKSAPPGKPVPISRIAAEEGISADFLEQICFKLKQAGIIRSVRGAYGGFLLDRPADNISMLDIFNAVGEGANVASCDPACDSGENACPRRFMCRVHPTWAKLSKEVSDMLARYTVKAICDEIGRAHV
jgi:Rrf2 family iron-sulfur cluster assembly transcriptional regulator